MLINSIKGKLLDLETIRYWQKDPNVYVRSATSAVFNLVHRDFVPLLDRLRSVIGRERQIPMLVATRKANIEHPPRAFVDIAIRNAAGSINFLKTGAPAAFAAVEDQALKREFAASNDSAVAAFEDYKTYLEQELKPKADGDFALGSDLFAKRMAYNEMIDIPPERLLDIAYAQLHKDRAALSEAARGGPAGRSNSTTRDRAEGDPRAASGRRNADPKRERRPRWPARLRFGPSHRDYSERSPAKS